MAADPEARTQSSRLARDVGTILLLLAAIVGLAIAVSWPWRSFYRAETDSFSRYSPSFDGMSSLTVKQETNGSVVLWQSANRKHLRNAEGYAIELSNAERTSIEKLYTKEGTPANSDFVELTRGAVLVQERVTELDPTGAITQTVNVRLRNAEGEYIVALEAQAPERELTFTPPALFVPSSLKPGKTWESEGQIGSLGTYTVTGAIAEADPYQGDLGTSDDCLEARIRFQIAVGGQVTSDRYWTDRLCAGLGQVDEVEMDGRGAPGDRWTVASANIDGAGASAVKLPAPTMAEETVAPAARDGWSITRTGKVANGVNASATIQPVYVPGDPPALLVATYEGDLIAVNAQSTGADVLWRFNPTGTVFGQPAFDRARGQIYFGASDKRLYALDGRGLFLWSFATGDNIATRPLIAGDLVIFGSEDRNAYAVEADTGKLRWKQELGSAVVSSPALATVTLDGEERDIAIFGSDDGGVSGLDAYTGEQIWSYDAGKAVEAPVVVDKDQVFIASTGGTVAALHTASGEEIWAADLTPTHAIRNGVAVTPDRVYVVDELNYLTALTRSDGRRIWQSVQADYFGAPLAAGDDIFVGTGGNAVVRIGPDGTRRDGWSLASASDAADTSPRLDFGPAAGGDALWLIDSLAVVRRIGSPQDGPRPLPMAWIRGVNEAPFALDLVRATPVQQGDTLLVLDEGGKLYRVDPTSGATEFLVKTGSEAAFVEPVIAGDLLISANNSGLTASRLSDGATAWHADGGAAFQPPVLAGDLVIWTSASAGGAPGAQIAAVNAKTGAVRWQREFASPVFAGGVAVAGDTIYSSTPLAALDLHTGANRWEAADLTNGLGAPLLSPDGTALYAGRLADTGGEIVALDTATGAVRWRQAVPGNPLNLLEHPWLSGDVLVIPTLGGTVAGLSAIDGSTRWVAELPAARFGAITVADGLIYTGLQDGEMLVLSTRDGRILARRGDTEGGLETYARAQRPVAQGDYVIMSFGSSLRGYTIPQAVRGAAQ